VDRTARGRTTAVFATCVRSYGKGRLVEECVWLVVVLHLDTVVGVNARAARIADIVFTETVVVEDQVQVRRGAPKYLTAQARLAVGACVSLPAIDDPGFDL